MIHNYTLYLLCSKVLDFFNSRMDAQTRDGEWSVEKVLEVIIVNCRSWRGEGIKVRTDCCKLKDYYNHYLLNFKLLLVCPVLSDVHSITLYIRTREQSRRVLHPLRVAVSSIPGVFPLNFTSLYYYYYHY